VSTDPGNAAVIGTDGKIYAPDEVFIGVTDPDTTSPGNKYELWVDPDASAVAFPATYAEETAAALPGGTLFPITYGEEKALAASEENQEAPLLKAKIGGVWTDVGAPAGGGFNFPSSYDEIKAAGAAP
jgi:hypothetical protein